MANVIGNSYGINRSVYHTNTHNKSNNPVILVGTELDQNNDNRSGIVNIDQRFLDKANSDPQTADKMSELLAGISKAESLANCYYNAKGGTIKEKTSHWFIDENGNCTHYAHTVIVDENNQKLREEAAEKTQKLIDKTREMNREKAKELLENRTDTITISDEARVALESEKAEEDKKTDEEKEVTEGKTTVTFNAEKRARQLAAAKNADEVRVVLALLDEDLSDCESGVKTGGCDEEEVAKVKRMIAKAKEKLSQVPDKPKDDDEIFDAFDIAMLM